MNAEMMAVTLTIALLFGLMLFMHYPLNSLPRRKKLAMMQPVRNIQYLTTRERLRKRVRARIGSRMQ